MTMAALLPWKGKTKSGKGRKAKRPRYFVIGSVVVGVLFAGLALGITKPEWQQYFVFGFTTRLVHTNGDYFTLNNSSKVKLAGVEVGRIDNVTREDDGTATMKVRIKSDVVDKVGTEPSAVLRPVNLLGGIIYMDLKPGGDRTQPWEDDIPLQRTQLPTELSQVVQALQPDALKGIPASINGLEGTLQQGGAQALQSLASNAPAAFAPAPGVLNAATGTRPGTDLPDVVNGLQRTTSVLARKDGQIESIVRDLKTTSGALAASSVPTSDAINRLPGALDTAIPGLRRLDGTLENLRVTSAPVRPSVQQLDVTLQRLNPTLINARPVVADLRAALPPTRALVQELVPTSIGLQPIFNGLNPSLDRLNGPIIKQLNTGFEGISATPSSDNLSTVPDGQPTLREELTPFFQGLANTTQNYKDNQGSQIAFNVGFGTGSVGGIPTALTPTELFILLARQINPNYPSIPGAATLAAPSAQSQAPAAVAPGAAAPLSSLLGGN